MLNNAQPRLHAAGLVHHFGPIKAVDNIALTLHQGEILGLLGPNGAGKSTTLRMLTGVLAPQAGRVLVCGHDLCTRPQAAKRCLGYLPEQPPLYPELTVHEYLHACARLRRLPRRQRASAVATALADCGLDAVARRLIGNLSKGYQQRVGIAQAIVHRPDVVILDEPTVSLDPQQIRQIRGLISRLGQRHSVILSSHILAEIQAVASRVMLIHQGRVVLNASLADLHRQASANIRLGLVQAPDQAALTAIPGVASAERIDTRHWRITPAADSDPRLALAAAAAQNNWGLFELSGGQHTLEEQFIALTTRDDGAAA